MRNAIIYIIIGIIGGVVSGMGMGGGTLLIPLLSLCVDVPQQTAQLLNLLSFIPMSVIALIIHVKNKLVVFDKLLYIIIPAAASAVVGSFFATEVNAEVLKKAFGAFLILLGTAYFLASIYKKSVKNRG